MQKNFKFGSFEFFFEFIWVKDNVQVRNLSSVCFGVPKVWTSAQSGQYLRKSKYLMKNFFSSWVLDWCHLLFHFQKFLHVFGGQFGYICVFSK